MQHIASGRVVFQGTVGREIERHSQTQPDHTAIVCTGYGSFSYRELQNLIIEIRTELRAAGFSRSARIAVALPNGPHAALAIVAVACSAVAIPLNPKHSLDEIEKGFSALRPDAVLLFRGSDSAARRAAERKGLAIIEAIPASEGTLGLKVVAPKSGTTAPPDEPDPDAPAFILQTSGTTSEPKSIPFSHRNMLAAAARHKAWYDLTPKDRCLSLSPIFYSHGLKVTVFTPLLTGGSVAFPADTSKFDYSEWFDALRPTWYSAGPTLHHLIFDQTRSRAGAKAGHSLRFITGGGAPLPRSVLEGLQQSLGVPVVEHYGSSEANLISSNEPRPGRSKPGTCGIPGPGIVMIVDENGRELPPGEQGEILVGGPTLISGYLDAPELNRASFIDGWFKTGDIGSIDNEGFLTLHGRLSDLINRGGEKISPVEIDDALLRHPAVAEAAAFAVPHARLGEDVAAAVVLRPTMSATPLELRSYLREHLASFKVPRRVIIAEQLPKGSTGKVLRRKLSESLAAQSVVSPATPDKTLDNRLLLQLRDLWEKLLNSGPLTIDDDFFEKGGDSLLAVEMLCEIERLTGQMVPGSILFEASTIRTLAQELHKGINLPTKHLIRMSADGKQMPLVLFHGDVGGGSYVRKLASLLGPDQPIFVIEPHGLNNTPVPPSLQAMAADRLPLIRQAQPHGPYQLAGYCMGGLVAFEVAHLLVAAGERVELVVMIDAPTTNARPSVQTALSILNRVRSIEDTTVERIIARTWARLQSVMTRVESFWNRSPSQRWLVTREKMYALVAGSKYRLSVTSRASKPTPAWWIAANNNFIQAYSFPGSRYIPKPLSVRVVYFSAAYDWRPWRRINSDLEVIKLSGDHYAIVRDCTELADHLRGLLQAKFR